VRWKAAVALLKIGTPAVAAFIGALRHDDEDVRWKEAITPGEIGDPGAILPLIGLFANYMIPMRSNRSSSPSGIQVKMNVKQ